jgi:predicted ATP-dependent endonuclease of OLD family
LYVKLINFRKFGLSENEVSFVSSRDYSVKNSGSDEINIALATSLIVGKNNTGKTTITKGLKKIICKEKFISTDFNFTHLFQVLESYKQDDTDKFQLPVIEFKLNIGLNDEEKDSLVNVDKFIDIASALNSNLIIQIKYEVKEASIFKTNAKAVITKYKHKDNLIFNKFLELINNTEFQIKFYDTQGKEAPEFSLKNLIELKSIDANNIFSENALSIAFNKNLDQDVQEGIDASIDSINKEIEDKIYKNHKTELNNVVSKIDNHIEIDLESDITIKKILNSNGKYRYIEDSFRIPENQYGLGYTNLMVIIAEIIDFVERYPNHSSNSKINIISIEEPETYMHPQMQELFIENINDAIKEILKGTEKIINCQLLITTHSSHILNSKISMGNTFSNINYLTTINNQTQSVPLSDNMINPNLSEIMSTEEFDNLDKVQIKALRKNNLTFLKKHIKYKVSEIFFSDAVILCEGVTEETLLKYYIGNNKVLNKYYISIFNIDGAHGKLYDKLLKLLKIPALIITDLDIKRTDEEKKKAKENRYIQIMSLKERITTNDTIKHYLGTDSLTEIVNDNISKNIKIVYQNEPIKDYYATSFEEALILTNSDNIILQNCIENIKPDIYKEIIASDKEKTTSENIKRNSYKLQRKLSGSKTEFANTLLFKMLQDSDDQNPKLPSYVNNGLKWIKEELKGNSKK